MTDHPRKNPRITAFIPVLVHIKGKKVVKGEVEDLSEGGAYVRCIHPLQKGEIIALEFLFAGMKSGSGVLIELDQLDDKAPIRSIESVEIRWARPGVGFGVQFVNARPETKRVIKKAVKYFLDMQAEFGVAA